MAWDDGVPWAIGGGSLLSAEMLRMVAWMSLGGNEGVFSSTDLEVKPLATPGTKVRVMPGACGILNRALNATKEAYIARLFTQDEVDINPTSGTGRSDLIIARIENPYISGEPWNLPEVENRPDGPYIFSRVIENVSSTCKTVAELNLGYSAIPLARLDIPSSTSTILAPMVVNLRTVVNPFTGAVDTAPPPVVIPGGGTLLSTDTSEVDFPFSVPWSLDIPAAATHADIEVRFEGLKLTGGSISFNGRLVMETIGNLPDKLIVLNHPGGSGSVRVVATFVYPDFPIPASIRGTTKFAAMTCEAVPASGSGTTSTDSGTSAICTAKFKQKPETTA